MEIANLTPIEKFYYGKTVFITGVTGFIGKMILEKLLRCCPGIGDIYLLMREKRGKPPNERLESMLNCELFRLIKDNLPEMKKKLKVVFGDVEKPNLGIGEDDMELLKDNVEIVFHVAARVRWDDPLKIATICHVASMKHLISLLHDFKKLQVFLYTSTSYVHRDPDFTVPEYVFKSKVTPERILDLLEWMEDDEIEVIGKFLMGENSNSYLLTKLLAENVIDNEHGKIPTAIIRPCLISPSYKDPFPGWCDTIQGMQGLMLAAAKGFLRTLYCKPDLRINLVPADIVVNTCLATAWFTATTKPEAVFVVNSVIEYEKLPFAKSQLLEVAKSKRTKYPLVNMYRYPDFTLYHTKFMYDVHSFFDHYIPGVIGDTFLFIFTGKTLMIRLYRKINFLYSIFLKVGMSPWICKMKNYFMVKTHLSEEDNKTFFMDTDDLNWEQYIDDMFYAGRKILAKEDPSNIPYARRKAKVWLCVTTFLKWAIILTFIYWFFSKFVIEDYDQLELMNS